MSLLESCRNYAGRAILVLPYYGHGWSRLDSNAPPADPKTGIGPAPFHITVGEFVSCGDRLVGATGTITEPGHALNGQWCGFLLRMGDDVDLVANPGHYMIWIAATALSIHPSPKKALYEWVEFDKTFPCLCGYGMVAEQAGNMGAFYKTTMDTRKRLLSEPSS